MKLSFRTYLIYSIVTALLFGFSTLLTYSLLTIGILPDNACCEKEQMTIVQILLLSQTLVTFVFVFAYILEKLKL